MTFSFRLLAIKRLFPSRRKSKEGDSNPLGRSWIEVVSPPKPWPGRAPQAPPCRRGQGIQYERKLPFREAPARGRGASHCGSLERGESGVVLKGPF